MTTHELSKCWADELSEDEQYRHYGMYCDDKLGMGEQPGTLAEWLVIERAFADIERDATNRVVT